MKFIIYVTLFTLSITACRRKKEEEKISIYPISAILQENAKKVDSAYKVFTHKIRIDSIVDSSQVDNQLFNKFSKNFFEIDLTKEEFNAMYKEASFQDASNGANGTASFQYDAITKDAPYTIMQIAMDRGTQNYTYAYLKKSLKKGDSTIDRKLYWYFNHNAKIIDIYYLNGKSVKTCVEEIAWNISK